MNEISQLAVSPGEGDCWQNVSGLVRKYSRLLLRDWEQVGLTVGARLVDALEDLK